MNNYYLYQHIRLDKNQVFYIGVGTIQTIRNKYRYYSRSKEKYGRNSIWKRIVSKTDYKIEILIESDNYDYVLEKEKEYIKLYGRIDLKTGTLANMTGGGYEGRLTIMDIDTKEFWQSDNMKSLYPNERGR